MKRQPMPGIIKEPTPPANNWVKAMVFIALIGLGFTIYNFYQKRKRANE